MTLALINTPSNLSPVSHLIHYVMFVLVSFLLSMGSFVSTLGLNEVMTTTTRSCIEEERQVLLFFKANLVDINNSLHDWGSQQEKKDCCKWVGVSCNDHTHHVIRLDLSESSHGLTGKISPYLPLLHQLEYLDLSGIDFQFNAIPIFLGSLTNLRYLSLSVANLSGGIPHQLVNLSNLLHLDLHGNFLEGPVPFPFGDLTSLTYLDLSDNVLNGSLPNFSGCSSLSYLSLGHNSFNGSIPDVIACQSLRKLDLSSNQFSGNLPKSVGQLPNLEYLDVSSNSLKGVISDVHFLNLTYLTYLDLSSNSFAFELSSHVRIPSHLRTIKLQSCKLGPSFPVWLKDLTFTHLDISSAEISDSIPAWFWDLSRRLQFLNISSNEIKGMLPTMTFLKFYGYSGMDMSNNLLEGRIPSLPSRLSAINLSGNRFTGSLSFLCEIDEGLTFLDLSNNLFSGGLPDCRLKFQEKLVVLNLSNNSLSRGIPSSLGLMSHLEALYLRGNAFVGELPISLSNCTSLRFIDLGENKLSGIIPPWIGERLSNLSFLVLRSNSFYGRLPSQLCWLNNLQFLDLSKNGISGSIPRCFGNFTPMARRSFEDDTTNHTYNSYSGGVNGFQAPSRKITYEALVPNKPVQYPAVMPYGQIVTAIFIDNAIVVWKGTERKFGRGLELLKSIDLSSNKLSGKFPYEITTLHELVSLNLSINKLHGELPKHMGGLKSLETLDLSINEFSGNIPPSLSEITCLAYLNLSNNKLSGRIPTGPQLQLFDGSSYSGNPHLYGPPLTPAGRGIPPATVVVWKQDGEEDGDELWKSYYMGMGTGFGVGFWAICSTIFFNRSCRYFLFATLTHIKDWIYVTGALYFLKLQIMFKRF